MRHAPPRHRLADADEHGAVAEGGRGGRRRVEAISAEVKAPCAARAEVGPARKRWHGATGDGDHASASVLQRCTGAEPPARPPQFASTSRWGRQPYRSRL